MGTTEKFADTRQASGPLADPLLVKDKKEGSGFMYVFLMILLSILSSVFIVLCNKEVFQHGFPFPLTMSWIAYVFTWLFYLAMAASGGWVPQKDENGKQKHLPMIENVKVALSSISSISFMNLCLLTNTVAIYQICKFATIPCTLTLQYFVFNEKTNWRVLASLVFILGGVGYSSFKGFEAGNLKVIGIIYAVFAVVSTSVYRIWQGTKQKEFKIGPENFQATMAGAQAALGFVAAAITEFFPTEQKHTVVEWLKDPTKYSPDLHATVLWMFGVCIAALTVNYTSMCLIGKTGPVAYAVVGHAKTVLTIILGIVLFAGQETPATIRGDIIGCGVAMFGVIAYGHFEYCFKNKVPDLVEQKFPSCVKSAQPKALVAPEGN